jgi:hypothetical protein
MKSLDDMSREELLDYYHEHGQDAHIHEMMDEYEKFMKNRSLENLYMDIVFAETYPEKSAKMLAKMKNENIGNNQVS